MKINSGIEGDTLAPLPKLFPWLLANTCVSEPTARVLWAQSVAGARAVIPNDLAAQHAVALDNFRRALDREHRHAGFLAHLHSLRRLQRRLVRRFFDLAAAALRPGWRLQS